MDINTENNDKEKETPADSSLEVVADNKPEVEKAENLDENKLEEKKKQFEQLKESVLEETEKLVKLRDERRRLAVSENIIPSVSSYDEADDDIKKEALQIFYKFHPEYSSFNDPGNVKFNQLNEHALRIRLGSTVGEIVDSLDYIHNNLISKVQNSETDSKVKVEDSGIGDTFSKSTTENKQPDILKRPLNKWETEAAKRYPGGEQSYREARAQREEEKKIERSRDLI